MIGGKIQTSISLYLAAFGIVNIPRRASGSGLKTQLSRLPALHEVAGYFADRRGPGLLHHDHQFGLHKF